MAEANNNFSSKYTKSRKEKHKRDAVVLEAANQVIGKELSIAKIKQELGRKVWHKDETGDSY